VWQGWSWRGVGPSGRLNNKEKTMANDAFPLDFESLVKGQVIGQERLEKIFGFQWREAPDQYSLKQMALCAEIRAHREDLNAHVRGSGRDILIMSDLEADKHTFEQALIGQRRVVSMGIRRAAIDRTEFSEQDTKISETRDRSATAMMIFGRKALKEAQREQLFLSGATGGAPAEEANQ